MSSLKSVLATALCVAALSTAACARADTASPSPAPYGTQGHYGHHRHHHGMFGMLQTLGLSQQQQTQIKTLFDNYRKAHPEGSTPDSAARQTLQNQILAVLTPTQRTKLQTQMQSWHARHDRDNQSSPTPQP